MKRFVSISLLLGLLFVVVGGLWYAGSDAIRSHHRKVALPSEDLRVEPVSLRNRRGETIAASFARGVPGRGAIVLAHGIGGDRSSLFTRARFLNACGFHVLALDLRGHGESEGEYVTFGYYEALDIDAAYQFVSSHLPGERIGAVGVSLGGAALLLSDSLPKFDAVVLESVYSTIEQAVENRLRRQLRALAVPVKYLLLWQLPLRLGIPLSALAPIDGLARARGAVMVASGTEDKHTLLREAQAMCDKSPSPKECWFVAGAAHVDLYRFARDEYEGRVEAFFRRYLQQHPIASAELLE